MNMPQADSNATAIAPGSCIRLHFALKLADGVLIDSTFDKQPASCVLGDGNLLPGFETLLLGLRAGDRCQFEVAPEHAFGMRNPNNIQRVNRDRFAADFELRQGLVVSFADAARTERPGVISGFDDQYVEVDFNHPLAGKVLLFEVEILAVTPA